MPPSCSSLRVRKIFEFRDFEGAARGIQRAARNAWDSEDVDPPHSLQKFCFADFTHLVKGATIVALTSWTCRTTPPARFSRKNSKLRYWRARRASDLLEIKYNNYS